MKCYGLIGRTLKHSFSKNYFTEKFEKEGLADYSYDNFELASVTEFPLLQKQHPDLKGLNITIPYKEEILQFLTHKNKVVEAIGACNCIRLEGEKLTGFNTDVVGFRKTLEPQLRQHHKKALILGTGGASKAIAYVLQELAINFQYVSRKKSATNLTYEDLDEDALKRHHLIINTTPLGTWPDVHACPLVPYHLVTPRHFLYDLIYNPVKTKFLLEGEKRGAQICNGYDMLIEQAEESWRIWNNKI